MSNVDILPNVQINSNIKTWSKKELKKCVDKQYWKIYNLKQDFQSYLDGSKQQLISYKDLVAKLANIEKSIEFEQSELYALLDELKSRGFEYNDDDINEMLETYL